MGGEAVPHAWMLHHLDQLKSPIRFIVGIREVQPPNEKRLCMCNEVALRIKELREE